MATKCRLSYKFQKPDARDIIHLTSTAVTQPTAFSLRPIMAPILDQGSVGDCVCNAIALVISTMTKTNVNISRLMLYAVERAMTGTALTVDSGMYIRDGFKAISKYGVCQEAVWPYVASNFSVLPPLNAFNSSKLFNSYVYTFINQDLTSIKSALYTNNTPIIFGINVYSSFVSATVTKTGIVPMPNTKTETLEGGHCVCIVGYDDSKKWFICANSWGTSWGDKGYFYMPYAYITDINLASDLCYLTFTF